MFTGKCQVSSYLFSKEGVMQRLLFFFLLFMFCHSVCAGQNFDRCQTRNLHTIIPKNDPCYETFFRAILLLSHRHAQTIVETVSAKSGAHGSAILQNWAEKNQASFYSIGSKERMGSLPQKIDFMYLSALDPVEEFLPFEPCLDENSVIMIDDFFTGKAVVDYLEIKGWKIACQDRQVIMVHKLPEMAFQGNPFAIDFPAKMDLSNEDYIEIQNQLRKIDIEPQLGTLYPLNRGYLEFHEFWKRCSRGLTQVLIDPERGCFPKMTLEKIGKGGDNCIVCCAPYNDLYPSFINSIPDALRNSGFNGYFLYQVGGFPNPTGREIQYVGVPYSFKIFMMLEAQKRGFNKVLWIDSAALPLRDPTPLFNWIDRTGALINGWKMPSEAWNVVLPRTRELVGELTGVDVMNTNACCTVVFGLKMNTEKTQRLIEEYYQMVELGTPFLSCFPEEVVLMALIDKMNKMGSSLGETRKTYWGPCKIPKLFGNSQEPNSIELLKKAGFYFYHMPH
jgi:hypothetical protein